MTTNDPSLEQITNDMRQHRANPENLQFSLDKQREYVGRINGLAAILRSNAAKIHGVEDWRVGTFTSALATQERLTADVKAIKDLVDGYLGFLSSFADAVQAAGHNIAATDTP